MYISNQANISDKAILGENIRIYGKTNISEYAIIEDNVTIGYPTIDEILSSKEELSKNNFLSTNQYLNTISKQFTFIRKGAHIKIGSTIYGGVEIEENVDCCQNVIIRDCSQIGYGTFIYPNVLIGRNVQIGEFCRISGTICNRTVIGGFATMLGHTIHKNTLRIPGIIENSPILGKGVNIGRESVIVGEITVGDYSQLATNSVLTKDLPSKYFAAGNPARIIKKILDSDIKPLKIYIAQVSVNHDK